MVNDRKNRNQSKIMTVLRMELTIQILTLNYMERNQALPPGKRYVSKSGGNCYQHQKSIPISAPFVQPASQEPTGDPQFEMTI